MNTANSQSVKIDNIKLVVEKLIELRQTSRTELAKLTTLNKATISSIINELVENELVIETDQNIKTSGRSAKVVALNKNAGRIISIELLTDSLYGVVTNLYGDILYELRKQVDDPEFTPYLKVLLETIDKLKANTKDSAYGVIGIGIGVYGILSKEKRIKFATFTSWKDIDLKQIVEDYTGIETYVENEANISALGEHVISPKTDHLVSLNIGIGVGMGIMIDNKLYTGENGYAGEIGHTILIPHGRKCICGNEGCLEKYISDPAIIQTYEEMTGHQINILEFIDLYKKKDIHAINIYKEFIGYVALTINNISLTLNPKTIVIHSKIIEQIPESVSAIKNKLRSHIMNLEVLSTSTYPLKANVMGLTHVLIQKFLNVEHYKIPLTHQIK